jgi:hypothetical protein
VNYAEDADPVAAILLRKKNQSNQNAQYAMGTGPSKMGLKQPNAFIATMDGSK